MKENTGCFIHQDAGIHGCSGFEPQLDKGCHVFPGARLVGRVDAGEECSFWYNAVVRGDIGAIDLGRACNIQDGAVLHVNHAQGVELGDFVTLGHLAVVHAARIGSRVLVGMHATVLDGAMVGEGCIIAAGALVPPGMVVPPGSLVAGLPAKVIRTLRDDEIEGLEAQALRYVEYARQSWAGLG